MLSKYSKELFIPYILILCQIKRRAYQTSLYLISFPSPLCISQLFLHLILEWKLALQPASLDTSSHDEQDQSCIPEKRYDVLNTVLHMQDSYVS